MEGKNGKKILIVEDDDNFLSILKKVFTSEGFLVCSAKDGAGGIKAAEKEKPDLIISDVLMPKMDGIEMAKKIKEAGPGVPIVFLTNNTSEGMCQGFDYMVKSETGIYDIVKKIKEKLKV